ncbi:D-alanyl-D-alanine carboxypeptidase [Streptomyces sp. NPDC005492]|uniref:D-alanyl-D-alanine carboxypeptidase n=1 Tax=Streptomyces sp. NPDC005492 TaxID=3156883 RepID=UPI0033BBBABE
MEEASVAGESPDRSKQRESSAEPTPGSASPVPEARGERERDPRLAVAREGTSPSRRGGVDTATKVFSIRELREETPETDETDSPEAAESTEDPESPAAQNPSAKGDTEGDARLRAAVAAWVTGPKEPGSGRDSGDEAEDDENPEQAAAAEEPVADAEDAAPEADEAAGAGNEEEAVADAETAAGGPEAGGAANGPAVAETPEDAEAEADGGRDGDGDVTEGESVSGAEPENAVAEAEGAADAEEPAADAETATEGPEADGAATRPAVAGTPEATEAGSDGNRDMTEGDPVADADPEDAAPETDEALDAEKAAGGSETESAATRPAVADTPEETEAGSDGDRDGDGDVTEDALVADADPEDAVPETDEAADAEEPAADAETAAGGPEAEGAAKDTEAGSDGNRDVAESDPAADDDGEADAATDPDPAPDDAPHPDGADAKAKPDDGPAEAIDHPTTVFKAVRPPKREVDQPTTMLKLGGATKTPETPKTDKTPESDAERTSRFVALKPLDEPRKGTPRPDETRPVPQVGPERTTQQPLPPKPPLDLLAELTNTPPPPQTPVRTAIRRVKIWTPLVILLAIVFAVVQALRPLPTPTLALTADDSYTFDGSKADLPWPSEGQGWMDVNGIGTMGSFGKQTPVAIGSVAKAMTAYIVLKDHPLKAGAAGEKITVDATAEKEGGYDKDGESTLNTVKAGDVLTEQQALSAIMIPSANNIARLLARWDAGSETAFIKKMNDTAKALGMTRTTYTDASGLKETTVSTAGDQVKLGNQLVKLQALMDITKLPSWVDPSGHKWTNYNRLVPYNNSLGIKTGTTTAAGGNLLFAATKEVGGETAVVVGAILGQHTAPIIDTVNAVSKTAMLAAQDAMKSAKILKKGDVVGYVDDQLGGHTPVVVTKDVSAVGWAGLKVKLSFASDAVPHSAKAGTKVGTLTVGDGSGGAVVVPVALQKDLAEPALTAKLTRLG